MFFIYTDNVCFYYVCYYESHLICTFVLATLTSSNLVVYSNTTHRHTTTTTTTSTTTHPSWFPPQGSINNCTFPEKHTPQEVKETGTKVLFTYSVQWRPSEVRWASRWDIYLQMTDVQIHWFSIINSLVVVFFLSGILTMIMIRTLRRDIAR